MHPCIFQRWVLRLLQPLSKATVIPPCTPCLPWQFKGVSRPMHPMPRPGSSKVRAVEGGSVGCVREKISLTNSQVEPPWPPPMQPGALPQAPHTPLRPTFGAPCAVQLVRCLGRQGRVVAALSQHAAHCEKKEAMPGDRWVWQRAGKQRGALDVCSGGCAGGQCGAARVWSGGCAGCAMRSSMRGSRGAQGQGHDRHTERLIAAGALTLNLSVYPFLTLFQPTLFTARRWRPR